MNASISPLVRYTPIYVANNQCRSIENAVCQELPLEIRINGEPYATLMRTPGLEKELAVGFCFTDRVIHSIEDVADISCSSGHASQYITAVTLMVPQWQGQDFSRSSLLKSSSGSVNKTRGLDDLLHTIPPITSEQRFDLAILHDLPEKLNACQVIRSQCGATHGAALFDQRGTLLYCAEDVGRHNGLDKLIGQILFHNVETRDKILMLSSRASFEMILKAVRISIPVVASVSAPTDLALQVAERLRCTYVSFLKKEGFYLYTHPWRFGL